MKRRLVALCSLLIVCFLSACSAIPSVEGKPTGNDNLVEYKNIAIQELNLYQETKLANHLYDEVGYINLNSIRENSNVEIENAEEKTAIDLICSDAKRYMDSIKILEEITSITFFSLQENYDMGEISRKDLVAMAQLVNKNDSHSIPSLSPQIAYPIKQEYSNLKKIKLENLDLEYYGNYNGYYALIMYDITAGVAAVVTKVEIGDVIFCYPTAGIEIIMCKIN